ncbi:MAG: hypothetical protein AB1631_08660 [Acidobacteriota bacterium]
MTKRIRYSSIAVLLIAALMMNFSLRQAKADDGERPIRLYATAMAGPIGVVEWSYSSQRAFTINGRACRSEQPLWGGEIIESPPDASLRIKVDSLGEVTLARGSRAALASSYSGERALIASLLAGEIRVDLLREATAYVEAGAMIFTASSGARFHIDARSGLPALKTIAGEVTAAQTAQRRYVVRPVGLGSSISVRARATRQIQVQVTDENDRPVPDLPVVFTVGTAGSPALGTVAATATTVGASTSTVRTDRRGIAAVIFTAGDIQGATSITATVEGTRFSYTFNVTVTAAGFWTGRKTATVAGIGAALAIGLVIGLRSKDELRPLPPPDVKP